MTRRNRPQRPGTDEPTTTTQQRGGGTSKRKDRNNHNNKNNNKNTNGNSKNKGGGGGASDEPTTKPVSRGDLPTLKPGSNFDSDSDYGYDGDKPYYDTDDGRIDAAKNPDQYYQFLNRMAGFSGNTLTPFGAYLNGAAQDEFLTALKNAQKLNPQLNPIDFAQSL